MATADQIERIVIELEEQGASGAYVAVKRVDGLLADLEKKQGPIGVLEGFNALQDSLSRSLVDMPNMAQLTDQAAGAWSRLVAQIRRYEEAQGRKRERNQAIVAAKQEAETNENAYRAALARQDEHAQSMRRRDRNAHVLEAKAQESAYQDALKRQDKFSARMRAGESPFGGPSDAPKKLSAQAKFGQMLFKSFGPKNAHAIGNVAEMLEKVGPVAAKVGPPVASAAVAIGALAVAAATGAAFGAKAFAGAVVDAQAYREDVLEAFKTVRRTQGDADRVLAQAASTADKLGIDRAQGAGQFLELLTKFQDTKVVDSLVRSLADLGTVDPNANLDGLTKALGKMQGQGKLTGEVLASLNDNGLEQGDVLAQLEKRYGKTREEINKMISAGKVNEVAGREAIQAAISQQVGGGPAGSAAAAKANRNLSSLMRRVEDIPKNILFDVAVGPGVDGIKDVLRDVLGYFDGASETGKEVRKVVGDLFNALIEGLTGDKVETKKGITGTLDAIVSGAKDAVPLVRDIASGVRMFAEVAATVGGAFSWVSSVTEPLGGLGEVAKTISAPFRIIASSVMGPLFILPELLAIGKPVKDLFEADWGKGLKELGNAMPGLGELRSLGGTIATSMSNAWEALSRTASNVFESALSIGANIPRGIISGIMGGIGGVISAGIAVGKAALGGTSETLVVKSPSQAYGYLGEMSTMGLENKLYGGVQDIYKAGQAVGLASLQGTAGAIGAANTNAGLGLVGAAPQGQAPITITLAPVIQIVGAKNEAQAQSMGAAAARGAQPELEVMLGVAMRRLAVGG